MLRCGSHYLTRFWRDNCGATAIEAAVAVPVFTTFIVGTIVLCHAIMIRESMMYGLDVAGRTAMVQSSTSNSELEDLALSKMSGVSEEDITITVSDSTVDGQDYKVLTASYTYAFSAFVYGMSDITMNTNVTVPLN